MPPAKAIPTGRSRWTTAASASAASLQARHREYFRPGRVGFKGNRACDPALSAGSGNTSGDWSRLNARWWSATCHRSLYGYQVRAALAIAIENPHSAVTFLPLACSGSTIDLGFFNPLRARECPPTGACAANSVPQMVRLKDAIELAQKTDKERKLDAILLTIGANDIWFAGLVANVITDPSIERTLFEKSGMIAEIPDAQKILDNDLPRDFAKLRQALKPYLDGYLQRIVYLTYGNPAMTNGGQVCAGGKGGFDVHPAFNVDAKRLRAVSDFVEERFLPRLRALATCDTPGACRDPAKRSHELSSTAIWPNSPITVSARVRRTIRPSTANASWKTVNRSKPILPMPPRIHCAAICVRVTFAPMRRGRAGSAPPMTAISPR